ncbi:MAG TPA: hypothetical protein VGQ09_05065 [Chitinophagaceae bacterium]|jgi:uncharacterized protein involved in cysteine biosynthesis|nr:hypothetical protein [Chitinophagaceae bacterium]
MRIKNNFDAEIKPYEWLFIVATIIIIVLLIRGDIQTAIHAITEWLKTLYPR